MLCIDGWVGCVDGGVAGVGSNGFEGCVGCVLG